MEARIRASASIGGQVADRQTYFRLLLSAFVGNQSMFTESCAAFGIISRLMTFQIKAQLRQMRISGGVAMLATAAELLHVFAFSVNGFHTGHFAMDGLEFASIHFGIRFALRAIGSSIRIRLARANSGNLIEFFIDPCTREQIFFDRATRDRARFFLIDFNFQLGDGKSCQLERFRALRSSQVVQVTRNVAHNGIFRTSHHDSITHTGFFSLFAFIDIRLGSAARALAYKFRKIRCNVAEIGRAKMRTRRNRIARRQINDSFRYRYERELVITDIALDEDIFAIIRSAISHECIGQK